MARVDKHQLVTMVTLITGFTWQIFCLSPADLSAACLAVSLSWHLTACLLAKLSDSVSAPFPHSFVYPAGWLSVRPPTCPLRLLPVSLPGCPACLPMPCVLRRLYKCLFTICLHSPHQNGQLIPVWHTDCPRNANDTTHRPPSVVKILIPWKCPRLRGTHGLWIEGEGSSYKMPTFTSQTVVWIFWIKFWCFGS